MGEAWRAAPQEAEIAERLKAASPHPWAWGADWATLDYQGRDGGGDKYADLQLRDSQGVGILPVRIDHYEPIWDCARPDKEPNAADRVLIAHAPADIAYLLGVLGEARAALATQYEIANAQGDRLEFLSRRVSVLEAGG